MCQWLVIQIKIIHSCHDLLKPKFGTLTAHFTHISVSEFWFRKVMTTMKLFDTNVNDSDQPPTRKNTITLHYF